jgi:hypothetical protein
MTRKGKQVPKKKHNLLDLDRDLPTTPEAVEKLRLV